MNDFNAMNRVIREINCQSDDYKKELLLRDKVLRKPLGLSLFNENLEKEKDDVHIGLFSGEELLGVLILTKCSRDEYKMRQVAVEPAMQKRGIGKSLVAFSEDYARKHGVKGITLHARTTAVPFYEKLGYKTEGDEFTEVTIPHIKMNKILTPT